MEKDFETFPPVIKRKVRVLSIHFSALPTRTERYMPAAHWNSA